MNDERHSILQMLSEGKITPDEAERLITALERGQAEATASPGGGDGAKRPTPKYLRIMVDAEEKGAPTKVNIRVPMMLLRAGVRLASLIPAQARDKVNEEMARNGVPFDVNTFKPENLEELIEQLSELMVDVDQDRARVRISCE